MKIDINLGDNEVVLSEVFSGVGIATDMGLFGIAQRDGGIEVMLDGKTVWTSHELRARAPLSPNGPGVILPDGSAAFVAAWPLPKTHWIYAEGDNVPPMPMRTGTSRARERTVMAAHIKDAARYAIRASTMNGKETDFDPDAMVQNMIVGLLGYWTENGLRGS